MNADKENTWRALKGLTPIQSFKCSTLNWHRWTNYEWVERNQMYEGGYAKCHCADCGLPRFEQPLTLLKKKKA